MIRKKGHDLCGLQSPQAGVDFGVTVSSNAFYPECLPNRPTLVRAFVPGMEGKMPHVTCVREEPPTQIRTRFARYLNPVLAALRELGGSARPGEGYDWVARYLDVSETERAIQNKRGVSRFENDVAWARFYLVRAGLLDSSKWGVWSLTERGRTAGDLTDDQLQELMREVQSQAAALRMPAFRLPSTEEIEEQNQEEGAAPEEGVEPIGASGSYKERVLELMRQLPPSGFERLCQRILREAGFQQVKVTGRSGDGGIDGVGVLQINPFVSFKVLFQSKRYIGAVSAAQVRDFRGAMMGRADKGLIITTGSFTADAQTEAVRDGVPPIELVDGSGLVALLEQLELGLKPRRTYDVDLALFEEFQVS